MKRWLVVFRSHHDEPADIHHVESEGRNAFEAILTAKRVRPPLHPWVLVRVYHWPQGCRGVVEAAEKLTGTKR